MYLVLVHLKSFISSVSAWTIEVYIVLTSLFHYCSVPSHFLEWLDKWSSPDIPSTDQPWFSRSCPLASNECDSPDDGHSKGGRKRKCAPQAIDIDSRSKVQKFLDWLKTCPSARDNKTASWDVCFQSEF
jgi:hypothetical protein